VESLERVVTRLGPVGTVVTNRGFATEVPVSYCP
jgi:hypothetical protein